MAGYREEIFSELAHWVCNCKNPLSLLWPSIKRKDHRRRCYYLWFSRSFVDAVWKLNNIFCTCGNVYETKPEDHDSDCEMQLRFNSVNRRVAKTTKKGRKRKRKKKEVFKPTAYGVDD